MVHFFLQDAGDSDSEERGHRRKVIQPGEGQRLNFFPNINENLQILGITSGLEKRIDMYYQDDDIPLVITDEFLAAD